jgi:tetratricopeptide (TPR) repeat protein
MERKKVIALRIIVIGLIIKFNQILMREHPDYYSLLHVSKQATQGEIKKSFRRLARQFHPDLNPNNSSAERRFKQICAAYQVLNDPAQRSQYDQESALKEATKPVEKESSAKAFQTFYGQGMNKLVQRNYEGAIADFNEAIALRPESVEAYLGRCQAHDALHDDRAVFDDCYQMLQINPQMAQAYFYQGCARSRLGYRQGAIDAYTRALTLDPNFASAYFHRGQAKLDQNKPEQARPDLQTAAELFQARGDLNHSQQANTLLNRINQSTFQTTQTSVFKVIQTFFVIALGRLPSLILNPSGNLLPTFIKLKPQRAVWAGILYCYIAMGCALVSERIYAWTSASQVSPKFVLASVVFFVTLVIGSAIARLLARGRGHWAGDFLLAGVVLLPLALMVLLTSVLSWLGVMASLNTFAITFASCYSILILYIGCTQLSNLTEPMAMVIVPVLLMVSSQAAAFVLLR